MSEMKMTPGGLGRAPSGSGSHLSDHAASRHGRADFDPSREVWSDFEPAEIVRRIRCLADDAPDEGDSPAQIWRHACDTILLRMGAFEPAPAIETEGEDAKRLSAKHESAVAEGQAPVNSILLSALKAMDEALTKTFPYGLELGDEKVLGEAWSQIRSAITTAEAR